MRAAPHRRRTFRTAAVSVLVPMLVPALVVFGLRPVDVSAATGPEPSSEPGAAAPPVQRGGTATGLPPKSPASATRTSLTALAGTPIRPKGAVADRLALPRAKGRVQAEPRRLTGVKVRSVPSGGPGTRTRTVRIAAATHAEVGDDTYVNSASAADRSALKYLRAGRDPAGGVSAAYLSFDLRGLADQYIRGATLNLWTIDAGSCTPTPADVYAVSAPWRGGAMTRWPGAPLGRHLGQASFAAGRAGCAAARKGVVLDPEAVTDWTHGAPSHGVSVRAANEGDPAAYKSFGSADAAADARPFLDVTYAAQGAAYRVDEVTLPTNTRDGELKATITNRGSVTWTPSGSTKFGFIVRRADQSSQQVSPHFAVPGTVGPGGSVQVTAPIRPIEPGDYTVLLTMYDNGADFAAAHGVSYGAFPLRVVNVPPSVDRQQPANGDGVGSITPTLYAEGVDDDDWPARGLKYRFKLCSGTPEQPAGCVESGLTEGTWTPPPGTLSWSRTYWWQVRANDTVDDGPWSDPLALTTIVPQPAITSHLGGVNAGTEAPGLDPQVGNYSAATTDASVATVGPDLTITRTYNSLDPRTDTAFGHGWASRLDTRLVPDQDGSGNVVVTLPSGREVRFGLDPDRTFAPPHGVNATLVLAAAEYTLRDASGTTYLFNAAGRLVRITDPDGLVEELEYDVGGDPRPYAVVNRTSKRRLTLTWQDGRVVKVTTDRPSAGEAPLAWTYTYDGPRLATACQPGPAPNCTTYAYQDASHYPSVVQDDNPRGFWRLGEPGQSDGAASVVARRPGRDKGVYHGVALGAAGALAGTADSAAAFDGQGSRVTLPRDLISPTMSAAFELWFRTTAGGVLASYADQPFGTAAGKSAPLLYVGQDGLLRGGFWTSRPEDGRQVVSNAPVNDGRWHHVVLSGFIDTQTLYVDGVAQDTLAGVIDHDELTHVTVGAGDTRKWPSGDNGDFPFNGMIDEVATYQHTLGATAVAAHFAAGERADVLVKVTLPEAGRVALEVGYDDVNDRVRSMTDRDGRAWRLDLPVRDEAERKVTLRGPYPDSVYTFDADHGGRPARLTRDGGTRSWEYNEAGFLRRLTDENGHASTYTTDDRGNVLSTTTCRRQPDSCQTRYSTYFVDPATPLDPRNDRKLSDSDARSSGPDDTTYRTTYGYDAVGRLVSTTHPAPKGASAPTETWTFSTGTESADGGGTVPRGLLVRHTGKRSTAVTDYVYRANGDLVERRETSGLRTRYEYDGVGRRTSATAKSALGVAFGAARYTYTPRSQIATVTTPGITNPVTNVTHTLVTTYEYDGNGNETKVTRADTTGGDPPRVTSYTYDRFDQLASTTFPDGGQETTRTLNSGMEVRRTDDRGITWITHTDSRGRVVREVASGPGADPEDPDATALVLRILSYDPAGRLAAEKDAAGRERRYTYYDDDRTATVTAVGVTGPGGVKRDVELERHAYDAAGNRTSLTTAGGRVVTSTYDKAGLPDTETLDPAGLARATAYTRDADGQPRGVTRTGAAQPGRAETTSYAYDAAGRLAREDVAPTAGDVYSKTYVRDERGLLTALTDRRRQTTEYGYDALGRLASTTSPAVTTWENGRQQSGVRPVAAIGRNAFGEVTRLQDPNGNVLATTYDAMGRQETIRLPDYTPPGGQKLSPELRRAYDRHGNLTRLTDALGRVTEWTYDPHGNLLTETLPEAGGRASTTTHGYSRAGERLSTTDPNGATTLATYDELGRQVTATDVERRPTLTYHVTGLEYDDAGNRTAYVSPGGNTARTAYNQAGEPTVTTDPTGRRLAYGYDLAGRVASVTDPAGITTSSTYDLLGNQVAVTQTSGARSRTTTRAYDPNGNLVQETSPAGRVKAWGFDALDRVVRQDEKVSDTRTVRVTFGYDAAGNRTRYVDGNQNATDHTFNTLGLRESTIEPATAAHPAPADRAFTLVYDAAAQLTREIDPGGVVRASTYDGQGRLTAQTGTGAEAATTGRTFGYDAGGRMTSFGSPRGDTTLQYDDRGNLLTTTGATGAATFTYTSEGLPKSRTDATGTTTFGYDVAGRLISTADGLSGRTIDQTYDPAGRPWHTTERGMADYVRRTTAYDPFGRVASDRLTEADPGGGGPRVILGTEYGYDGDGNITSKKTISENAVSANAYAYDGAGRLTSWTAPDGTVTGYEWDDAGNRTRAGATTFTYDQRNAPLTAGETAYTYRPRGTMATSARGGVTTTTAFDAFGRKVADAAVDYGYDSLDRVATRGGAAFSYAGVENDVVSDGARLTGRGPNGEPVSDRAIGSTATAKLLYADQHGDVTARYRGLDSHGQRAFDPFGAVRSTTGEMPNLGYQGEWTDPANGGVNMHARWYEPRNGGFTSRDTMTVPATPASAAANRYGYGGGSPLTNTDPSGHWWFIAHLIVHGAILAGELIFAPEANAPTCPCPQGGYYHSSQGIASIPATPMSSDGTSAGGGSGGDGGHGVGGGSGGGGKKPTKRPRVVPPPPPPPLWLINLWHPVPRQEPGTTTVERPDVVDLAGTGTLVNRSLDLAAMLMKTSGTSVWVAVGGVLALVFAIAVLAKLPEDQAQILTDEVESCLNGTQKPAITYWDLDDDGRATGADACLDRSSLVPGANEMPGHKADSKIGLVGLEKARKDGKDEQRFTEKGHLIAANYGGSGKHKENLVPVTARANKQMYNQFEKCVVQRLEADERVFVLAVPAYKDDQLAPAGVQMIAIGNKGYRRQLSVWNDSSPRGPLTEYCT
ncbi:DNRLRE domain-containing protein [Nonomuraea sp. NPDC050643]|uniref:DNRLRE domain-containing protein n=1 Tax=Nonomuraea sp. NPDC050643 TaxID=3155660 RepID=UPI003403B282